jgi:UDP-glucose 4-epimerase
VRSYLVTGGAGFIGSHLCDLILARGERAVALDDLSTGRPGNVAHLMGDERFRLVVGSASDPAQVDELTASCDVVIHLAAAVGVELIRERPFQSASSSVAATMSVLDAAVRHRRPVLIASSSEVYGYSAPIPVPEDAPRVAGVANDVRASYAASKALEETLALGCAHEHGLPVVVARLFNTVGPRQRSDYGMVLPRFAERALAGRPLRVYGDGRQTRCFAHVLDVVQALWALAGDPDAAGEAYNVGSQEEVSVLDLAGRVMAAAGVTLPIDLVPFADDFREAPRRVPDIAKVTARVGWVPKRGLATIISDVLDAYRSTHLVAASS